MTSRLRPARSQVSHRCTDRCGSTSREKVSSPRKTWQPPNPPLQLTVTSPATRSRWASSCQQLNAQSLGHQGDIVQAIILAIGLLAPAPASTADDVAVPERFVGTWASSPASCGSGADDLVLRLASRHISYWESQGPIRSVIVRGDEIALIAALSGERETWLATARFKLSPNGRMLTDSISISGKEIVRYRCSGAVGTRPNNSFKPTPLRGAV